MEPETNLDLLTREGILSVRFIPALTDDQCAELYDLLGLCTTKQDTKNCATKAAAKWGIKVEFP